MASDRTGLKPPSFFKKKQQPIPSNAQCANKPGTSYRQGHVPSASYGPVGEILSHSPSTIQINVPRYNSRYRHAPTTSNTAENPAVPHINPWHQSRNLVRNFSFNQEFPQQQPESGPFLGSEHLVQRHFDPTQVPSDLTDSGLPFLPDMGTEGHRLQENPLQSKDQSLCYYEVNSQHLQSPNRAPQVQDNHKFRQQPVQDLEVRADLASNLNSLEYSDGWGHHRNESSSNYLPESSQSSLAPSLLLNNGTDSRPRASFSSTDSASTLFSTKTNSTGTSSHLSLVSTLETGAATTFEKAPAATSNELPTKRLKQKLPSNRIQLLNPHSTVSYRCPFCRLEGLDKPYTDKRKLRRHLRERHYSENSDQRCFGCGFCGKVIKTWIGSGDDNMVKHVLDHIELSGGEPGLWKPEMQLIALLQQDFILAEWLQKVEEQPTKPSWKLCPDLKDLIGDLEIASSQVNDLKLAMKMHAGLALEREIIQKIKILAQRAYELAIFYRLNRDSPGRTAIQSKTPLLNNEHTVQGTEICKITDVPQILKGTGNESLFVESKKYRLLPSLSPDIVHKRIVDGEKVRGNALDILQGAPVHTEAGSKEPENCYINRLSQEMDHISLDEIAEDTDMPIFESDVTGAEQPASQYDGFGDISTNYGSKKKRKPSRELDDKRQTKQTK